MKGQLLPEDADKSIQRGHKNAVEKGSTMRMLTLIYNIDIHFANRSSYCRQYRTTLHVAYLGSTICVLAISISPILSIMIIHASLKKDHPAD